MKQDPAKEKEARGSGEAKSSDETGLASKRLGPNLLDEEAKYHGRNGDR
jgi:hypothetical protein